MNQLRTKQLIGLINLSASLGSLLIITLTLGFRVLPPIFILVVIPLAIGSVIWHIKNLSENRH